MKKELIILSMLMVFITVAKVALADSFKVSGIIEGDGQNVAVIDGKIVEQGSEIEGVKVLRIECDSVILKTNQNQIFVRSLGTDNKENDIQSEIEYQTREEDSDKEQAIIEAKIESDYQRRQSIDQKWEQQKEFEETLHHDEEVYKLKHAGEIELIQKARLLGGVAPEVKVEEDD